MVGLAELVRRRKARRVEHYLSYPVANFKIIGQSKEYGLSDIPLLVADMRASYDSGYTRPLAKRLQQLKQLKKMLVENEDTIIKVGPGGRE